jgi:hypothetical protein
MAFIRTMNRANGIQYQVLLRSVWDKRRKQSRQIVVRWFGRVRHGLAWTQNEDGDLMQTTTEQGISVTRSFRCDEENFITTALARKRSLLLYGNWGVGKTFLAQRVAEELLDRSIQSFYFRWTSPQGAFISGIADALGVDTHEENDKGKPVKRNQNQLMDDIGESLARGEKVLIVDKAQNIPVALRNQFEVWLEQGATILLCATLPKRAELFLKFPRCELRPLSRESSLALVRANAARFGVTLSTSQAAEIVSASGGNPQFLIRAVSEFDIGTNQAVDHLEWIDGTPFIIACLCLLMLLRFIGRGLNDQNLVLMGGVSMVILRLTMLIIGRVSRRARTIE